MANIKPQNPVGLGLCSGADLEKAIAVARAKAGTVAAPAAEPEPEPQAPADGERPTASAPVADIASVFGPPADSESKSES